MLKDSGLREATTTAVNLFKVKPKVIPSFAYKYRYKGYFEQKHEYYKRISLLCGTSINEDNQIFLSLKKNLANDTNIEVIDKIDYFPHLSPEIPITKAEQLLTKFLRWEKKVEVKLNKALQTVRSEESFNKFSVKPYIRTEVKYFKGNPYLVVDFRHMVTTSTSLWEYVNKSRAELTNLIGKKIKFLLNPKRAYTIKGIENPDAQEVLRLINYYTEQGYIKDVTELEKKYGKTDYDQFILRCREIQYPFLPQHCALVFDLQEIENTNKASELMKYWRLSNKNRFSIIKQALKPLEDIVESLPASVSTIKLPLPDLIVKNIEGKETTIKVTSNLFPQSPFKTPYLPYEVPSFIAGNTIPTFVLIDNEIPNHTATQKAYQIFSKYNKISRTRFTHLPYFDFSGKVLKFNRKHIQKTIQNIRRKTVSTCKKLQFALIIGKEKYPQEDYYEDLKRQLFQMNIISQNVLWNNLNGNYCKYVENNLLIQIMGKLGIKYFVLREHADYDYILGVDVGKGMYGNHRIAGCTVIFDSNGRMNKIVPVKVDAPGETVDIPKIIEHLQNKSLLNLEDKDILILRDGKIQLRERRDLSKLSKILKSRIVFLNLKKDHNYRIESNEQGLAIKLNNITLLLPHTTHYGSKPVKIDQKYRFEDGNESTTPITIEDIKLLYNLTKLNYSSLFNDKLSFRLPAPVHYADKFVKALSKGWEINEELLQRGCLYFI